MFVPYLNIFNGQPLAQSLKCVSPIISHGLVSTFFVVNCTANDLSS